MNNKQPNIIAPLTDLSVAVTTGHLFSRAYSPQLDSVEAQEMRRLREKIALLPQHQPFQQLEIVATLGSGGFGRVELVRFSTQLQEMVVVVFRFPPH